LLSSINREFIEYKNPIENFFSRINNGKTTPLQTHLFFSILDLYYKKHHEIAKPGDSIAMNPDYLTTLNVLSQHLGKKDDIYLNSFEYFSTNFLEKIDQQVNLTNEEKLKNSNKIQDFFALIQDFSKNYTLRDPEKILGSLEKLSHLAETPEVKQEIKVEMQQNFYRKFIDNSLKELNNLVTNSPNNPTIKNMIIELDHIFESKIVNSDDDNEIKKDHLSHIIINNKMTLPPNVANKYVSPEKKALNENLKEIEKILTNYGHILEQKIKKILPNANMAEIGVNLQSVKQTPEKKRLLILVEKWKKINDIKNKMNTEPSYIQKEKLFAKEMNAGKDFFIKTSKIQSKNSPYLEDKTKSFFGRHLTLFKTNVFKTSGEKLFLQLKKHSMTLRKLDRDVISSLHLNTKKVNTK